MKLISLEQVGVYVAQWRPEKDCGKEISTALLSHVEAHPISVNVDSARLGTGITGDQTAGCFG